jgi:thiol-disulfide isomerase/thioredoxin
MTIRIPIRIRRLAATAALLFCTPMLAAGTLQGTAAPDFALGGLSGPNMRLSEHRGEVVMLNFWATWCGPCRQEMPLLEEIHGRYRDAGFTVIGVNVDGESDRARRMAGIRAMPVTFLIDRDGTVRHVHQGYRPGFEDRYLEQVRQLVTED